MLATLSGDICLLFGLALLLLPLLAVELSRPRDGVWGAVVLILGLVLVTSSDRMRGAPMLAVLCGSLLISRLSAEVGQARWRALSEEEQKKLGSPDHWLNNLQQLGSAVASLGKASQESSNNSNQQENQESPQKSGFVPSLNPPTLLKPSLNSARPLKPSPNQLLKPHRPQAHRRVKAKPDNSPIRPESL